jgi:hypothetical protein
MERRKDTREKKKKREEREEEREREREREKREKREERERERERTLITQLLGDQGEITNWHMQIHLYNLTLL